MVPCVYLGTEIQTHGCIINRAWRATCGVRDHGQGQSGQEHQHAGRVQQGFTPRLVHQTGCCGHRQEADGTHQGRIIADRHRKR